MASGESPKHFKLTRGFSGGRCPSGESHAKELPLRVMSKFVKDLLTRDLQANLSGVNDALLVNVVGLNSHSHQQAANGAAEEKHQAGSHQKQHGPTGDRRHTVGAGVRRH